MRIDIGNGQSVAIYLDKNIDQPSIQFRQGNKDIHLDVAIMNLDYGKSKAFLQAIPDLNKIFSRILAGEWDIQERMDLADKFYVKISAKKMPQIKIVQRSAFARWVRFDISYLEWARLCDATNDILAKLFRELEDHTYEKPLSSSVSGYRWRMITSGGDEGVVNYEIFTGPWQNNIHSVASNCKEFVKRMKESQIKWSRGGMVIDMKDNDQKVRTLGPIAE